MSPVQQTKNVVRKLDDALPGQGLKAAWTGFIALLLPWVADLVTLVGGPQIPPEFVMKTQGVMTALVALFMLLKWGRSRQYDGR